MGYQLNEGPDYRLHERGVTIKAGLAIRQQSVTFLLATSLHYKILLAKTRRCIVASSQSLDAQSQVSGRLRGVAAGAGAVPILPGSAILN